MPPVGRVIAGQRRGEPGAQLVGDHDVQQRVERLATPGGGDLADGAAGRVGVLGGECLGDDQPVPLRQAAQHARLLRGRTLGEPATHLGVGERGQPLGHRQMHRVPPARQPVEHEAGQERQPDLHGLRQGERHHPAAALGGDFAGAQLPLVPIGVRRRDAQQVPVQRSVGGNRHVGEQRDVVVGEARQAAGDDRLERGARMVAEAGRQGNQFLPRRAAGRYRLPATVVVGRRLRGRQPERAGAQCVVKQRDHPLDLLRARIAADGIAAHRRQPKCRMANQEAGIDGDAAVEAGEPVTE